MDNSEIANLTQGDALRVSLFGDGVEVGASVGALVGVSIIFILLFILQHNKVKQRRENI